MLLAICGGLDVRENVYLYISDAARDSIRVFKFKHSFKIKPLRFSEKKKLSMYEKFCLQKMQLPIRSNAVPNMDCN